MKKIVSLLLVMSMVFVLVACGASASGEGKGDNTSSQATEKNDGTSVENQDGTTSEETVTTEEPKTEQDNVSNGAESKGFSFESNDDGTCTLTGIGACTDKEIVIPEKAPNGDVITLIGEYAFYNVEKLESITFSGKTMEIDDKAFASCSFKKLVITDSKLTIGENAFSYCEDIAEILISNSELQIGEYAFYDAGKNMNVKFEKCTGTLGKVCFQSSAIKELTISECTFEIGENAFAYSEDITALTFDQSALEIDKYAFYDTGDDMVVTFADSAVTLEDNAFQSSGIMTLSIVGTETIMGEHAFAYCEDLETVTIGNNKTEIGSYAFYDCTSLKNVSIAAESENKELSIILEKNAFQSCAVEKVVFGKGKIEIGDYAFAYCEDLVSVEFKGNTVEVEKYSFYDCSEDIEITYGE